jgi:hypothetical protein
MAGLTLIMVALYLIYGYRLIQALSKSGGSTGKQSTVVKNLYFATTAFCVCFGAEAVIWIVSAVIMENLYTDAAPLLGCYYGVNVRSALSL